MAVKIQLKEVGGSDVITLSFSLAKWNSSGDYFVLEYATNNFLQLKNLPSYEDVYNATKITKTYEWIKDSRLTLKLNFRAGKASSGHQTVRMTGSLTVDDSYSGVYFGRQYPEPMYYYDDGSLESSYTGNCILFYNPDLKKIASCSPQKTKWAGGYYGSGQDYYTPATSLVEGINGLEKGNYNSYTDPIYFGGQKITSSTSKLNNPTIGMIVSETGRINAEIASNVYNMIFNYEPIPSYPGQNPDDDDDPNKPGQGYPDTPLPGDGDTSSDPIPDPPPKPLYDVTNTGFVVIYNPSVIEIRNLAYFMWSGEFVDLIKKMFASPFEAIISLKMLFCNVTTGASQTVWLGNVETDVSMPKITDQFTDVDLGTLVVNEFFGSFADYAPFTKIQIYLPFIGYKDLNVDEVMGAAIHLRYRVDVYTGACIAYLTITKEIKSTQLNAILYEFDGNCAMEIPFTSNDNSRYVSAIMNSAAASAMSLANTSGYTVTQPPVGDFDNKASKSFNLGSLRPVAQGMLDVISAKPNIQRAGALSGAVSAMAVKQPYIIIHRPIAQMPSNYQHYLGIPLNLTQKLSDVTGFTIISQIFFSSTTATDEEIVMITELLKGGIIL